MHARTLAQAAAAAEVYYDRYMEEIERDMQDRLTSIQTEHDQKMGRIQHEYEQAVDALRQELADVEQACGLWALGWDDPYWDTYEPDLEAPVPILTRLGTLRVSVAIRNME
jgi:hypothetical protein